MYAPIAKAARHAQTPAMPKLSQLNRNVGLHPTSAETGHNIGANFLEASSSTSPIKLGLCPKEPCRAELLTQVLILKKKLQRCGHFIHVYWVHQETSHSVQNSFCGSARSAANHWFTDR